MASNWSQIDMQFPSFTGKETTEEKVTRIQNYLFMLMEFLRYSLRNLDSSNFNSAALEEMTESFMDELRAKDGFFENLVTDNLYADFGSIADLTVNSLRTDWKRAQRWLDRDTSDLDYITVRDETMQWVTGTTDGLQEVQLRNHRGEPLYWVDPPPRRAELNDHLQRAVAGVEYEQIVSELPDLVSPVIHHVEAGTLDSESGIYKLTVSKDDCTLDARAKPFFFFAAWEGVFEDYTVDGDGLVSVVFKANPDTGGRGIQVITGVGDNLGQVYRKELLVKGA